MWRPYQNCTNSCTLFKIVKNSLHTLKEKKHKLLKFGSKFTSKLITKRRIKNEKNNRIQITKRDNLY